MQRLMIVFGTAAILSAGLSMPVGGFADKLSRQQKRLRGFVTVRAQRTFHMFASARRFSGVSPSFKR